MWIRIQDQRLKDSQIVEYKGRSKGMASGLYTIEIKYGRGLKYFKYESEEEYEKTLSRLDEVLKVQDI
jgi:hypothetical protein